MFSEILKIIPKLDDASLRRMENALSTRFARVAKKFGAGIANVFKGGGLLGVALGLIDKLLNPLKEVQEALDRTLKSSDDIATNANQFNTSSGKLFKLIQLAKSTGLDQDSLFTLMNKFQHSVAEAAANPNAPSAVKNYVSEKDTAQGFFEFIQSLQKMEKNQQLMVQSAVFGEKQTLKMADFLQTDFTKQFAAVGLDKHSSQILSKNIEKLGGLNDMADALKARSETNDMLAKGGIINADMIKSRAAQEELALKRENARLKSYTDLQAISQTVDKIFILIEEGVAMIGKFINFITPAVNKMIEAIEKFTKGPVARGLFKMFGKGD